MLKNKSTGFVILLSLFLFFLLFKAVALVILLIQAVSYFSGTIATESISGVTIIMLLADFISNLVLWGINKGIKLIGKAPSYALLFSPVLLLAVMYLSVEVVLYETGSTEALRIETISWVITAVYLLVPDTLLALDLSRVERLKMRLAGGEKAKELTLSEKIRRAKK